MIVLKRELTIINSSVHNPTMSISNDSKVVLENVNIEIPRDKI